MQLTAYPDWLPQCEPTSRDEITTIFAETSDNGVIRGRVMYDTPTYRLTLSHTAIDMALFARWEDWWRQHNADLIQVKWMVDDVYYEGIFDTSPPTVDYTPYKRVTVTTNLLVKKSTTRPSVAIPGTPGYFDWAVPNDLAMLVSYGALGNISAWTTGQWVILGDGSETYWDGFTWKVGKAP
jgi:hypothetical protein